VKRCPTCHKTFASPGLSFCTDDGTPLVPVATPDDEATVVRASPRTDEPPPAPPREASSYQPPGAYVPPGYAAPVRRRVWPWIVAILAIVLMIFAGLGIAAALLIPKLKHELANANSANQNSNQRRATNQNANDRNLSANSAADNSNTNTNSTAEAIPAPVNEDEVLQQLTDLEQEWTVANINADKKKLDRILADDYVGSTADGKPQGKADYLRTATRDMAIQKWNFEDLKLSLKGDRATLNGLLQLNIKTELGQFQDLEFTFTDKFVWRDGRWQATGSEVKPVNAGN
jgi:ketosteroid isomerase-like protein